MTLGLTCAHEWARETKPGSPTNVVLACRSCGASSVSHGTLRGSVVTASLDIYPPVGLSSVTTDLYDFFVRQWDAECQSLAAAGYTVTRRAPSVHSSAAPPSLAARRPSQWLNGRDVAVGTAISFVSGVVMLVLGLSSGITWLSAAGAVVLGLLAFLTLLVVFLSS
jgi:hypothetical protein